MGFAILLMNLFTFIIRWFCADKKKGLPPLRLVNISDLRFSIAVSRNNVRYHVVADLNLMIINVDRTVVFFLCMVI